MNIEDRKLELIENVIHQVRTRMAGEQVDVVARFVANYYQQVDPDDLAQRSVEDLYGAVLSHWHFIQQLGDGLPKLRVYNPNVPEQGWQSPHTIIEILNDDMPFLVDSIVPEINRQGLTLHLIIHPVMRVVRDETSQLLDVAADRHDSVGKLESLIHLEVDRRSDAAALEALQSGLARVLADVRAAVEDWPAMQARLGEVLAEINRNPPPQDAAQTAEDRDFLQWIANNHFTLLGYRQYDLGKEGDTDVLRVTPDSGLGILRGGTDAVSGSFATLPPEVRAQARERKLLILAKSNARATVHRQAYLDYIGVKRFDHQGEVIGEHRFLGLFTFTAYNASPTDIPLLRRKVGRVMERTGFLPNSHGAKALAVLLEQYPRDELFQIDEEQLYMTAMGILRLGERQKTRLFVRRDPYGRFFSCLIFVPRDRYNTELRERMQSVLMAAFAGTSAEFSVQLLESMLARVLMIIHTPPGSAPEYDVRELEQRLAETARLWEDKLAEALVDHCGEELGNQRMLRYGEGFPAAYRETVGGRAAVYDIDMMETLESCGGIAVNLYVLLEDPPGALRFRIYHAERPVNLSDSLPMLEHMGVRVIDEQPYYIARRNAPPVWIHDFGLRHDRGELPIERLRTLFHEAFLKIWRGEVENDNFNRLVLVAGLDWRQVKVLRAYGQYLRQIGFTFSRSYVQATVAAHPAIVRALIELFEIRFDPNHAGDRSAHEETKVKAILEALDQVENIDDDRILRQFLALIRATLRTNYYRREEGADLKHYLSFKFDPKQVPGLPEPRPMFEIF
ncbi:MAG: NAD-glutamate dehydrogenase, partial [Candidatus Competibacteraceae bacterium]|nr:NAD-glutamate dehydrogenase [Candidatus Competibacteraceae bacterium]